MDCSPPGSSAHGISLARILEWVSVSPALTGVLGTQVTTVSHQKPVITITVGDTRMGWQHSIVFFFFMFSFSSQLFCTCITYGVLLLTLKKFFFPFLEKAPDILKVIGGEAIPSRLLQNPAYR